MEKQEHRAVIYGSARRDVEAALRRLRERPSIDQEDDHILLDYVQGVLQAIAKHPSTDPKEDVIAFDRVQNVLHSLAAKHLSTDAGEDCTEHATRLYHFVPGKEKTALQRLKERSFDPFMPNQKFTDRWSFAISLCMRPDEAEAVIDHLEDVYHRDIKRYGLRKARVLYRKNVILSLGPLMKWAFHRTVVLGIIKHYLPAVHSIARLFR